MLASYTAAWPSTVMILTHPGPWVSARRGQCKGDIKSRFIKNVDDIVADCGQAFHMKVTGYTSCRALSHYQASDLATAAVTIQLARPQTCALISVTYRRPNVVAG